MFKKRFFGIFGSSNEKQSQTNSLNIEAHFYKRAVAMPLHGRLLVNSRKFDLNRKVIDFSLTGLDKEQGVMPALTPGLLDILFQQARDEGFEPISLVHYNGVEVYNGMLGNTRENYRKFREITFRSDVASVGTILVEDSRRGKQVVLELRIPELNNAVIALSPKLLKLIFESIKEQGVMPINLLSFQTQTESSEELKPYSTYYEEVLGETTTPAPAVNTTEPVLSIPSHLIRQEAKQDSEKLGDALGGLVGLAAEGVGELMKMGMSDTPVNTNKEPTASELLAKQVGSNVQDDDSGHLKAPVVIRTRRPQDKTQPSA